MTPGQLKANTNPLSLWICPCCIISHKQKMWTFLTGFFDSECFQGSSTMCHVSVSTSSFYGKKYYSLYRYARLCLFTQQLVPLWAASIWELLWITRQWTLTDKFLCEQIPSLTLRDTSKTRITGSHGNCVLNILRNYQIVFQSSCIVPHSSSVEGAPVSPHPHQTCQGLFHLSHASRDKWHPTVSHFNFPNG